MNRARGLLGALVIGVGLLASAIPAGAGAAREERRRIALLIGTSAYKASPLRNPVNDVRAMAQRLRELGLLLEQLAEAKNRVNIVIL